MVGIGLALAIIPSLRAQVQVSVGFFADTFVEYIHFIVRVPELAALRAQGSVSAVTRVKSWSSTSVDDFRSRLRLGLWLGLGFGLWLWLWSPEGVLDLPNDIVDLDCCLSARTRAVLVLSTGDIIGLSSVIHADSHSEVKFKSTGDARKILAVELKLDLSVALGQSCLDELNVGTLC